MRAEDVERLRLRVMIAEALDYGRQAEAQIEAELITPKPSRLNWLFGLLGASDYVDKKKRRTLTNDQARNLAAALDLFAAHLGAASTELDDSDLVEIAADAHEWGSAIWGRSGDPRKVYEKLTEVLATLDSHNERLVVSSDGGSSD